MLECESLIISDINYVNQGINNWFLLNKEKKVRFINLLYIPPERTLVKEKEGREETPGYFLIIIHYETSDF